MKYTSKNTSVNSKRIPSGFSFLLPFGNVIDYGCGKYWKINRDFCESKGAKYIPYDKYNIESNINLENYNNTADIVYCTNVLNVIYDAYDIIEIIENISKLLKKNGIALFQIYEGDKSGIGKETKKDCWQRNQKTSTYKWFFEYAKIRYFQIKVKENYIIMKRSENK